jgi:hypothetical protein
VLPPLATAATLPCPLATPALLCHFHRDAFQWRGWAMPTLLSVVLCVYECEEPKGCRIHRFQEFVLMARCVLHPDIARVAPCVSAQMVLKEAIHKLPSLYRGGAEVRQPTHSARGGNVADADGDALADFSRSSSLASNQVVFKSGWLYKRGRLNT